MKLFKKKSIPDTHKDIYLPKGFAKKVYPKRKKRLFNNAKSSKKTARKPDNPKIFLYIFLPILFAGVVYFSIIYINNLRNDNGDEYTNISIMGINDVPAYPNATFIFQNSLNQPSVTKFLSEGNSAYRLPMNASISDINSFYSEKLPQNGWQFIMSVPTGSEGMRSGEYWIKENRGLRIYSKFNDIWYQTITIGEAQNGLADDVKAEIERGLLLADNDSQDLLPDFPWIIKIPKEYIISYSVSDYKSLSSVTLKKLGTEEVTSITPIGDRYGKVFDYFLNDYVKSLNEKEKKNIGVKNTFVISTNMGNGLRGSIGDEGELREIAVIPNPYNNTTYIIDSKPYKSPFFEYILSNLEPQDKTRY